MTLRACAWFIAASLTFGALAPSVLAAPTGARPTPKPSPTPGISQQELDEIERALQPEPGATAPTQPLVLPPSGPLPNFGLGSPAQGSMNPDIAFIFDAAVAAFSDAQPLQTGAHDPNRSGFNFQQLEMSLGAPVDPYFRFDSNVVFGQFGVEIEEAYATTSDLPLSLQARAGQFLTRFGRINGTHPHSWEFSDQPFIIGKFMGPEGNRGVGTELSWLAPLPWYAEVVGSLTDAQGGATARSFYANEPLTVLSPLDLQATAALKQFFPFGSDWSLAWGLSGAAGPNPTGRLNRSSVWGTDLYLKFRPLSGGSATIVSLTTEALARSRQIPGSSLFDVGGYSSLFWRFAPQWGTALRYEYGSGLANDYLDADWTGDRQRVSANLTYWPTEFSRLRLQGNVDRPSWRSAPIYGAFLTFEVLTGAHGAHKF